MLAPIFLAVLATPPTAVPPQSVTHPPPPAVEAAIQAPKLPWPPPGVLRTGTGIVSPRLISEVKPNYTPEAMRAGIEGAVHLDVVVQADGRVGDVLVIGPLDPGLDAEAVRAVRQWQFEPGRRGGVAVPVLVEIEMTFTMRDQPGERPVAPPTPVAEPAPSTPWPPAGVLRTGLGITSPRLLRETKPNYTGAAMRAGIQGTIWLEAVVDTEGRVGEVRVMTSLDQEHGLDAEAVRTLKQWRFAPAMQDGKPVPVVVDVQLMFALRK